MTTIPPLSEGTTAAIANLTDYSIEHEYGVVGAVDRVLGATTVALAGLQFDLRAQFVSINGTDAGLAGYAQATLRVLVRQGLEARLCQCHTINDGRCPHAHVGSCGGHYEADVPAIDGALLCGTCHIAEYQARAEN